MSSLSRPKLPLSVALPLFVAVAMFLVAVGTTQIGIMALRSSNETGLRDQALVFLDAVAGNIAAEIREADARQSVQRTLAASLEFRTALLEESIAARWTDTSGETITVALAESDGDLLDQALNEAQANSPGDVSPRLVPDRSVLLVARSYGMAEGRLYLAATFDTQPLEAATDAASNAAIGIDILVAIIAAAAAYVVTRRSLKPLDQFIDRLADPEGSSTNGADWRRGNELRQLEAALAMREQSEAQRVTILEQMAQQERDGLLARMAASIAHEVRNPLAGLKNGISTLKRFGDREDVRKETLAFLENGLDSIGRVVDVTLSTYRRRSGSRMITAQDIRDLEILIAPEAGRAGVGLAWMFEEPTEFRVDVDALRQILINLMLNAVRASPPGSTVTVSLTRKDAQTVVLSVADEGPGMPPEIVAAMISGRVNDIPVERSIGIWIVASLVERIGADLSIRSDNTGTNVQLTLATALQGGAET
ncbi:MAG: HAMP domain-containing histidine kinase [Alphaproteobacteria bacterium]|uniref:sensor histidine kinase n=1 Tax=Agrobacterium sp. MA01 TaxID=2664893 RepID=UPI00129BE6C0|nr:HAMP domain-containing sensor histidine kinase [Agrobacterium sp. MA01]MBU0740672.1 HAMP domain-containing histidine kinase [Alphaproteobacteria bacterium]MBU0834334.1 HAMP domain-containing histidine kinase [Alphaproteobacteria bacterium]MBU1765593.1 HAMP domain-containing histidine kinase [Alphaproteobacteria bacterium]QGG89334.1 sensor histidine kinase [Agrobacterium sp. MA01]